MLFNAALGLCGLSAAACGNIKPHLGQPQQPAFLNNRLCLLRTFDDLGGSEPMIFFFAHVTSPMEMMV